MPSSLCCGEARSVRRVGKGASASVRANRSEPGEGGLAKGRCGAACDWEDTADSMERGRRLAGGAVSRVRTSHLSVIKTPTASCVARNGLLGGDSRRN